jgi:two-component system, cell cycle response regulator
MDPLVRASIHLQHLSRRLAGTLVSVALAIYLVAWATDPPPAWMSLLALLVLLANIARQGVALARRQSGDADIALFTSLSVMTYAAVLELPSGLDGAYYPLVYVMMMVAAAYCRPLAAAAVVLLAAMTEAGLRAVALGQTDFWTLCPRVAFLGGFTVLNSALFRAEIERVRRVSRELFQAEFDKLRGAARAYRLTGTADDRVPDRALQSAVGEVEEAARYALRLLKSSLALQGACLLQLDGHKLTVFEAETDLPLTRDAFSASEGLFAAVVERRQPITILGPRARHHAALYDGAACVEALCAVPILEGEHVRGVLVVDRAEEKAFPPHEMAELAHAAEFLLRAIENERVFSALSRVHREQAKLYRAVQALAGASTEAEVIEAAVESAREVAAFDFAAVTLFQRKDGTHEIVAVSGDGAAGLVERTFRHNAGLVSMVVANRHALPYRGEYDPSRQTVFAVGLNPPKVPSLLVLPLGVSDRVLGTLVLGSKQAGAFSESVRPALEVLASHMAMSLSNARMVKRLEEQATTDGMTGLLNKRTLIVEAEKRLAAAARFKKPLSILVTDIDHFKKVNDTYGHDVGDVVIKGMGDVLRRIKRDTDIVGRFGGEEFVIVCEHTDEAGAKNLGERIRRELESTTFQTELGPLSVTASIGVATFPAAGADYAQLFKATDEALYVAKRSGRNQVVAWSPRLRSTSTSAATA